MKITRTLIPIFSCIFLFIGCGKLIDKFTKQSETGKTYPEITYQCNQIGEVAHDLIYHDQDNQQHSFSQLYEQKDVILLIISSFTCGNCREEAAHLHSLKSKYDNNTLEIVEIIYDTDDDSKIKEWNSLHEGNLASYIKIENKLLIDSFIPEDGFGTPYNIFIDARTMRIKSILSNGFKSIEIIEDEIETILDTQEEEILITKCGNGYVEVEEICDSNSIACSSMVNSNFTSGIAICKSDCSDFDTSQCVNNENGVNAFCGNGAVEKGEVCDKNSKPCIEIDSNYISGIAVCNNKCSRFKTSQCIEAENTEETDYPTTGATCENIGDIAHDLTYFDSNNNKYTFSDLYKKKNVILLIISSTYCGYCKALAKDLPQIYNQVGQNNLEIVEILINADNSNLVGNWNNKYGGDFAAYVKNNTIYQFSPSNGFGTPYNIIIDTQTMKIKKIIPGWVNSDRMVQIINDVISKI